MSEKDETATAVLDQELVDEILQEGQGIKKNKGRLVRIERDEEADEQPSGHEPEDRD